MITSATTIAPTPVAAAPRPPRAVSPFYWRYLNDQASAIRSQGGNDDDVAQFIDAERDAPMSRLPAFDNDPPDMPNNLRGVSMALVQGATFGWGDEAVGSLLGVATGVGAREGIEQYRREYEAWGKEHGGARIIGELAGGVATGTAFGMGTTALRTIGIGAGAGATAGAGYADGTISDRMRGALLGATLGAATAGAVVGIGAVVRPIARPIAERVVPKPVRELVGATPEARARELLAHTLASEGLTPAEVTKRLVQLQSQGVPATILEIGGDATLRLAADAARTRSPLKTQLLESLLGRQSEQGERLLAGLLGRAVRRSRFGSANAYEVEDALRTAALRESAPHYRDAYQQVVQLTPRLQHLLKHPKIRAAWEIGAKLARDEDEAIAGAAAQGLDDIGITPGLTVHSLPKELDMLETLITRGVPPDKAAETAARLGAASLTELPVRGLDFMKRGLDIVIERGLERGRIDKQGAKALARLRDEIIREARKQVGAYDTALTTYAGYTGSKNAVTAGREFLRRSPGEVKRELARLSPAERDFYRIGAVQSLYEKVFAGGTGPRNVAARYFGGRLFGGRSIEAERIRALFPDAPAAAEAFLRQVAGEARISYTTGRVVRMPRAGIAERAEQATEGNVLPVRGTALVTALSAARGAVVRARSQLSEEVSDELTHLFGKGLNSPTELRALVDDLFGTYAKLEARSQVKPRVIATLGQRAGAGAASEVR